jgi:hypothetical protein
VSIDPPARAPTSVGATMPLSAGQLYALHTAGFLLLEDEQLLSKSALSAALSAASLLAAANPLESDAACTTNLPPSEVAAEPALSSLCEHPRITELLSELTGTPEGSTPAEAALTHRWDGDAREFQQDGPARLLRGGTGARANRTLSQLDTELYWRSPALRHSFGYVRDARGGAAFLSLTAVWALEAGAAVELLPASHAAAFPPSPDSDELFTTLSLPTGSLLLVARSLVASGSATSSALLCVDYATADTFPTGGYELDSAAAVAASSGWVAELTPAQRRIFGPRLTGQLQFSSPDEAEEQEQKPAPPATADQAEAYCWDTHGYCVLRQVMPPQWVRAANAAIDRLLDTEPPTGGPWVREQARVGGGRLFSPRRPLEAQERGARAAGGDSVRAAGARGQRFPADAGPPGADGSAEVDDGWGWLLRGQPTVRLCVANRHIRTGSACWGGANRRTKLRGRRRLAAL